jgi:hypothetical protein
LLHELVEKEHKLPEIKRYIHSVIVQDDIKIAVTMHPRIIRHIHSCRFLAIDFTFKRVEGDTNEWEVASNLDRFHMRMSHLSLFIHGKILMKCFINYVGVTLASLFCNKARRDAFRLLF